MATDIQLKHMADKLRIHSLKSTTAAGSGHPTSCMSCAEIVSCLFFSVMGKNDEFILSKGHAAPILWSAYAEAGFVPLKELMNLRKIDSVLEGHPTPRMSMVKVATGSLGQGLAAGAGMALADRMRRRDSMIYVLMGDGECAEGSVWEAANVASYYRLTNLCAIVDVNKLGQSQHTMHGNDADAYKKKFEAFGWSAEVINGHDISDILDIFRKAKKSRKPFAIIARTSKGKGVSFLENKEGWHGKVLKEHELEKALKEIGHQDVSLRSNIRKNIFKHSYASFIPHKYHLGDNVSTREAFGRALLDLGKKNRKVVSVDGDVGNSTMLNYFSKRFPKRNFQCFIAEQAMAGVSLGLSKRGFIPFAATFAAFWTRAHDFIRMAGYSNANIKFIGSHAGVSIGQDGPSQMGLEDLPMFLSIPGAAVLYPSDAVSTENLVKEMMKHTKISYLRTTREATPVLYKNDERFPIGRFKVLRKSRNDKALVIAAGITVHEALKAYEELKRKDVHIRVIDLYSIKPLDRKRLRKEARECGRRVIVAEDHYPTGIGAAVAKVVGRIRHLCIKQVPRSGKPEELMARCRIDSDAIIDAVRKIRQPIVKG
jgi:transketolase